MKQLVALVVVSGLSALLGGCLVRSRPGVYVAPRPVYLQPQPVYVQPQTVYVRPQPVYVQPQPVVQGSIVVQ